MDPNSIIFLRHKSGLLDEVELTATLFGLYFYVWKISFLSIVESGGSILEVQRLICEVLRLILESWVLVRSQVGPT